MKFSSKWILQRHEWDSQAKFCDRIVFQREQIIKFQLKFHHILALIAATDNIYQKNQYHKTGKLSGWWQIKILQLALVVLDGCQHIWHWTTLSFWSQNHLATVDLILVHLKLLKPKQLGHCSLQQSCLGPASPHSSSIGTQAGEGISVRDSIKRYSMPRQW